MKINIRKILLCYFISFITAFLVYCFQFDYAICEQIENEAIDKEDATYLIYNERLNWYENYVTLTQQESSKKETEKKESKEASTKAVLKYELSNKDVKLLQRIVMGEAEGETLEGKMAVAQVVINRSILWNKSIYDIIYQKIDGHWQFTSAKNGRMDIEPNEDSIKAVDLVLQGKDVPVDENIIYFYAKASTSRWHERNLKYVKTIGGHKFFKDKE